MKKIISIFILLITLLLISSCSYEDTIFDSEFRELKNEYDSLVLRKEKLENELAELQLQYQNFPIQIQQLEDRIKGLEDEISSVYSLFSTLENEILKGAVIVSYYLYEESGWGWFTKEEVIAGALGSGFVIKETDQYYYILTNNHVVHSDITADKESIYVYDYDMNQYVGTVLFSSEEYDMALISINKNSTLNQLRVMELASDVPSIGDEVIAIGQPQGQVNSISIGNVKNFVRITNVSYKVIYHTAWIDHGNSGGMLLDINLNVVGINTWGGSNNSYTNHESLSSPVDKIKEFLSKNSFTL